MQRTGTKLFSPAQIGSIETINRIVRSGTWDPVILQDRQMKEAVLERYRNVAAGGAGLIITGDIPAIPADLFNSAADPWRTPDYDEIRIHGFEELIPTVREAAPDCRLIVQIGIEIPGHGPSSYRSPFAEEDETPLSKKQIQAICAWAAETVFQLQKDGFDGVQIHGAHGGMLSRMLTPYANQRTDEFGGSASKRSRIIHDIVSAARSRVGDFPILIKINATDNVPGGLDLENFPDLARSIADCGVDAIEISGGDWNSLVRTEEELGFPPLPAPESHTRINKPENQSYYLPFARVLDLEIPLILVGGNRDVEGIESILQEGCVDFISMCRPLLCEPDLPTRWLAGEGPAAARCIACNSCIHHMYTHMMANDARLATCVYMQDRPKVKEAQVWLKNWVSENIPVATSD